MSIQLSANSFLQMLAHSDLLSDKQLKQLKQQFPADKTNVSAEEISGWLVSQRLITDWQAEKLLQARFRGFFLGPYKLLHRVARGGMSTIYAARHQNSGEIHALKVLPLARTGDASYLARFQREAEITQRLQHLHIVKVFGIFADSDGQAPVHFMAMELLQGRDLFEAVNTDGPLPWQHAAEYIRQTATGLAYAHQQGLVHRDIKPGNLFLTAERSVRILDLGLAQDFDSEESLTRDFNERVIGTADYLAPEQATDSHTVDARADVYSLGCTFYFLLTGRPPFTEGTLIQRLMSHQTKTPPPVSQFRNDVPEELITILSRMMARHRNQRIVSADEVAKQLREILTSGERPQLNSNLTEFFETTPEQSDVPSRILSVDESPDPAADQFTEESHKNELSFCDDASWFPLESTASLAATPELLPAFSQWLQDIGAQCSPAGVFAADPRRADLLETVQRLSQHVETDVGPPAKNVTQQHIARKSGNRETTNAEDISNAPEYRGLRYILGICIVLLLIAIAAATVEWDRLIQTRSRASEKG